jgi:hypothetical protein
MPRLSRLRLMGVALVCAIALSLLSVHIERVGPELAAYGDLCGPSADHPCYQPVLKGGFPVAYLFDAPGVSVERRLTFGEDQLSSGALLLDIAIYFSIVFPTMLVVLRRRSARMQAASRAGT